MTIEVMDLLVLFAANVTLQCMVHGFVLGVEAFANLRLIVEILHEFRRNLIHT